MRQLPTDTQKLADLACTTDETDVMFRNVLQDPEVLSPSTESLLRGPKLTFFAKLHASTRQPELVMQEVAKNLKLLSEEGQRHCQWQSGCGDSGLEKMLGSLELDQLNTARVMGTHKDSTGPIAAPSSMGSLRANQNDPSRATGRGAGPGPSASTPRRAPSARAPAAAAGPGLGGNINGKGRVPCARR